MRDPENVQNQEKLETRVGLVKGKELITAQHFLKQFSAYKHLRRHKKCFSLREGHATAWMV
jgi:AmiR/NasT family two-component response regulator